MDMVSRRTIRKFQSLPPEFQKVIESQIELLSKKPRKKRIGICFFRWMLNPKKDFEMTDEEIDNFISAVRAEKNAVGH